MSVSREKFPVSAGQDAWGLAGLIQRQRKENGKKGWPKSCCQRDGEGDEEAV